MIIVADSGSTKADWIITSGIGPSYQVSTMGLNPFLHSTDMIEDVLLKELVPHVDSGQVVEVHFYGAGCSDEKRVGIMATGLQRIFPHAHIQVEHDLLAAARATCMDQPGISCILGTGSNSCLYDGRQIQDNVTSLGYLVGDEGSGSHLGKYLIRGYFYREMPAHIAEAFRDEFAPDKTTVLDQIYGPAPNVYLASLAPFVQRHLHEPYISELAKSSFRIFIDRHVTKYWGYKELPIHFIGSIAHHFEHLLLEVLDDYHLKRGVFLQKPIHHLVSFHLDRAHPPST